MHNTAKRIVVVDSYNEYSNEEIQMINKNLRTSGVLIDVFRSFDVGQFNDDMNVNLCAIASVMYSVGQVVDYVGSAYIGQN